MSFGPGPAHAWLTNLAMWFQDLLHGREVRAASREAKVAREARITKRHTREDGIDASDPEPRRPLDG